MATEVIPLVTLIHMVTTNYLLWHNQVIPMLRCDNLLPTIDGTTVEPPPTMKDEENQENSNPDFIVWIKKHNHVVSVLLSSSEEAITEVTSLPKARNI
ncbi:hypothetical protein ACS0TY_029674 [Phlomoides rotata]